MSARGMVIAGPVGAVLAAVVGAALAGCTTRLEVLGDDELPLTTCDQVWLRGAPGDPCELAAPCARPAPPDPACCTAYAYCRMGALVMDTTCNPDCATCVDDHGCAPGGAVCNAMRCEPCPPPDPDACPGPCPPGWTTLTRNGCATCECAPPSECEVSPGPCGPLPDGDVCYRGARFVPGCAPDDPGCFANVCSAPGCLGPAPLGCFTACGPALPNCAQCATAACECDPNGAWVCQAICVDDTPQSLTCFL